MIGDADWERQHRLDREANLEGAIWKGAGEAMGKSPITLDHAAAAYGHKLGRPPATPMAPAEALNTEGFIAYWVDLRRTFASATVDAERAWVSGEIAKFKAANPS